MNEERKAILISNPNAGRGGVRREREVESFCEALRRRGIEVELKNTEAPGDATRLAAQAASNGVREIIVSGGDGTINEALQGLVGSSARLGVWPAGTANVLAREIGLPRGMEAVADVLARGRALRACIGCATEERSGERRYFVLMAGIGLDASVVRRTPARLKRRFGKAAFWYAGLGHLVRWIPEEFSIEMDGKTYPGTFAAIGKSPRYGGGLAITPRARLDLPEFEVCVINSHSRVGFLRLLAHSMRGGVDERTPGVSLLRATRLRAEGDAHVQADGELIGRLPMTFEIIPERIDLIVP